jgi:hypothetical protein
MNAVHHLLLKGETGLQDEANPDFSPCFLFCTQMDAKRILK